MTGTYHGSGVRISHGDSLALYDTWGTPTCIMVDGPYGIGGYVGDPTSYDALTEIYEPHVAVWSARATPETTLWFWGTELGWATVHPLLRANGWVYKALNVWDKGLGHIAGNVNTGTIRSFPVVTEVCAHYTRPTRVELRDGQLVLAWEWMRREWLRTGLPLTQANKACGVADAATRKWLTTDEKLWYPPSQKQYDTLAAYANEHGKSEGRPYFSHGVIRRARFKCEFGITNVWSCPQPARGDRNGHPNAKPLELIRRIIEVSTLPGDLVWEPFGGTCPSARVCVDLDRLCESAEMDLVAYEQACSTLRLAVEDASARRNTEFAMGLE